MAWITIDHIYPLAYPYRTSLSRPEYRPPGPNLPVDEERPVATLRGGTLLHNGFYDLLALIPTPPSVSVRSKCRSGRADPPPDVPVVAGKGVSALKLTISGRLVSSPQCVVKFFLEVM